MKRFPTSKAVYHRMASVKFAMEGILLLVKTQRNFQIHLLATVIVIILGIVINLNTIEWAIIIICCVLVLSAEAFNTSIELLCDMVTKDYHPLIKRVKDVAAGGVLIVAIGAFLVGSLIVLRRLF